MRRGRIAEYVDKYPDATFHPDERPWGVPVQIAIPCATQNELNLKEAQTLIHNGVLAVVEGANMPTDLDAAYALREANVLFAPAKAANAGGVAVSGLEQSQNALRLSWSHEEVDSKLRTIMADIHRRCVQYGSRGDHVDYIDGANLAGFVKIAEAMLAYGAV